MMVINHDGVDWIDHEREDANHINHDGEDYVGEYSYTAQDDVGMVQLHRVVV